MAPQPSIRSFALSESAVTLVYGDEISIEVHRKLMALAGSIRLAPFEGFTELSIAFNSITVFFDPWLTRMKQGPSPIEFVRTWLEALGASLPENTQPAAGRVHILPVCYEPPCAPDLNSLASYHQLDPESVIRLHSGQEYYVFMVGFTPGFPYMGILPDSLATPRKSSPALKIPAGSVGIAGKQTGIYPFSTPGGWNIIGRTPMKLFDISNPDPCLLQAGDTVRFQRIDLQTFLYLNQYADS